VLHEVEHLRRGDDWTNLVQKLCLVLFPLNPALWWIERQLCKEREMACDEGVIAITREPRAYAACLTSLAERGLQRKAEALSLGAWQRRPELVHRVHSILRRSSALGPFASGALLSALGGSLLVVSLEFARCPQFVAFVPSQKIALAANHLQSEGAASVDVVYRPEARRLDASSFHAVEAKAVMATAAKVSPRVERTEIHRKPLKPSAALHAQEADAKLTATQATPDAGQQWIVLTSWEQVETSSAPAERAPGSAQSAVSEASSEPDRQVTSRITVTQLVFRVVSSASKSSQPKAMPFRDGWFVIQL
jgi:hypothetical protein